MQTPRREQVTKSAPAARQRPSPGPMSSRVSASGNGLTKTDPGGKWNAGAVSIEALTADG